MIYKPAKGAPLNNQQAQRYGERMAILEEENNGLLPEILIEDGKREDSPLHDWFEWDDKRAARRYRIEQAEHLLRSIVVMVKSGEDEEREVRAFHAVEVKDAEPSDRDGHNRKRYVSISNVLSDQNYRKQLVEIALRELEIWRKKYATYQELTWAVEAVSKVLDQKEAILFEASRS